MLSPSCLGAPCLLSTAPVGQSHWKWPICLHPQHYFFCKFGGLLLSLLSFLLSPLLSPKCLTTMVSASCDNSCLLYNGLTSCTIATCLGLCTWDVLIVWVTVSYSVAILMACSTPEGWARLTCHHISVSAKLWRNWSTIRYSLTP